MQSPSSIFIGIYLTFGRNASGERVAFAQPLLASLYEDVAIEEMWAAQVERRIADVESGAVQVIPIAEALAQVRAALK